MLTPKKSKKNLHNNSPYGTPYLILYTLTFWSVPMNQSSYPLIKGYTYRSIWNHFSGCHKKVKIHSKFKIDSVSVIYGGNCIGIYFTHGSSSNY